MMIHRGKMQVVKQSCAFFCGPFSFNVVVYCYICTMKMVTNNSNYIIRKSDSDRKKLYILKILNKNFLKKPK